MSYFMGAPALLGVPRGAAALPALALRQPDFESPATHEWIGRHPLPMNPLLISLGVGVGVGVVRGRGRQIGIVVTADTAGELWKPMNC